VFFFSIPYLVKKWKTGPLSGQKVEKKNIAIVFHCFS